MSTFAITVGAWMVAAGQVQVMAQATPGAKDPNRRCMQCHGQAHIAELGPEQRRSMVGTWLDPDEPRADAATTAPLKGDEPAVRPALYIAPGALAASPHAATLCVECHEDAARLPHAPSLNRATCGKSCHMKAWEAYNRGSHQKALARGEANAPTCASCHGGHEILHVSDRRASQYRLNSLFLCGDCHKQHGPNASPHGEDSATWVGSYLESAHAKAVTKSGLLWAATCVDCHGAHGVLPSKDPQSQVNRAQIPATCGRCHEGIVEEYSKSIHGRLVQEGSEFNGQTPKVSGQKSEISAGVGAPTSDVRPLTSDHKAAVCTDCHSAHKITRVDDSRFLADVINECGQCHDNPDRASNGDRVGTYYRSYHESYHGQVTKLGGKRAARCSDCHGSHDILPVNDPASRVNRDNLIQTCSQAGCHPHANARFVQFDPHANHRDAKNYPLLHGVWLYFMAMMTGVFTFFGVHTLLWFIRSLIEGRGPAHHRAATAIRRFTTLNRINHALVALTFFGLTATGIPLFFSGHAWTQHLANLCGGIEAAGLWHRFFAILLIVNFLLHFVGLGQAFFRRSVSWRRWLFGPNSLVPRWKDVTDCVGMFRWFVGLGAKPALDRWTYWEKFDYWAEVFGSVIIGGTGLLLWFPELASRIVPGWAFNVASIVHGYEALLAIGFIFTIHFFNAHIRPGTFPVDEVIFTGSVPEEELKHQRPQEYKRLLESGRLESLRVAAPTSPRRPVLVAIAAVSVAIGVTLLALIILGGLGLI